ncbi:Rv3235 family protein [Mycobacterium sp.]|uniref:Rv3235 family protein n=1 Tax=Mycobacterium sp. TaxID=1785 RepID=UPI002DB00164|nr:Rv3235 family protein [Mycobacterium sp.]
MTASRIPSERTTFTSPIINYEPAPLGAALCPPPSPAALHRSTPRRLRPVASRPTVRDPQPPHVAVAFADAALRRVLEVIDRRRPVAQLRPLVAPVLIDAVVTLARTPHTAAATLRRVRLRMVDDEAAEVFGSYTRGPRVRAIAARVEQHRDRWRIVALQIG